MASAECMKGTLAPTPQRCSVSCSVYRQCVPEGCGRKHNTIPNHDTRCRTIVAMHDATVQKPLNTVSPNSNLIIVMLQAEAEFANKYNFVPFRCSYPPFITPLAVETHVVFSQGQTK
ncbi:hypothetical protein TNCV_939481 [Trichonephila clavipes]|nr:hypothetical protein TNCV_939481 [Trichonephila clavipes]